MALPDDRELMMAVRNGDLDKLGVLFERHHKSLYNFFLRQSWKPEMCEDLVQDVFYKMLRHRSTYKGTSKFTTWMFRIAVNAKIDYLRKPRHEAGEKEIDESMASAGPSPEEMAMKNSENALLMKALNSLPDDKQEVLLLKRFENMKYDEIAKVLGCKEGTVKARVHWAMKDLTREYQKLTEGRSS
jgi:RNA polymerase sigma-70 factor (ECF subfamily)